MDYSQKRSWLPHWLLNHSLVRSLRISYCPLQWTRLQINSLISSFIMYGDPLGKCVLTLGGRTRLSMQRHRRIVQWKKARLLWFGWQPKACFGALEWPPENERENIRDCGSGLIKLMMAWLNEAALSSQCSECSFLKLQSPNCNPNMGFPHWREYSSLSLLGCKIGLFLIAHI